MKREKKHQNENKNPKVNPELEGFDISVNTFGEITSTLTIDKINQFLNRHVKDKKLKDRDNLNVNKNSRKK